MHHEIIAGIPLSKYCRRSVICLLNKTIKARQVGVEIKPCGRFVSVVIKHMQSFSLRSGEWPQQTETKQQA